MYCNYCGKVIQEDANLCAYCGTRVGGMIARNRLVRPRVGRKIAGVCIGVAEYFDLDVSLVRVVWVIVAILGVPVGIVGYIVGWIVMANEPERLVAPANSVHATPPP